MTQKEFQVIKAWLNLTTEECGAETASDLLEDNYSWASFQELVNATGLEMNTVKGILGSLTKKDYVFIDSDDVACIDDSLLVKLPQDKLFVDLEYADVESL